MDKVTSRAIPEHVLAQLDTEPWYRQFWPWFLISIPGITVIAGVGMIVIATLTADGMVVDDYYKQGLAINEVLDREINAQNMGLSSRVIFDWQSQQVQVTFQADELINTSPLVLLLAHPTKDRVDLEVLLHPIDSNVYRGSLSQLETANWHLSITDSAQTWKLSGRVRVPAENSVELTAN